MVCFGLLLLLTLLERDAVASAQSKSLVEWDATASAPSLNHMLAVWMQGALDLRTSWAYTLLYSIMGRQYGICSNSLWL